LQRQVRCAPRCSEVVAPATTSGARAPDVECPSRRAVSRTNQFFGIGNSCLRLTQTPNFTRDGGTDRIRLNAYYNSVEEPKWLPGQCVGLTHTLTLIAAVEMRVRELFCDEKSCVRVEGPVCSEQLFAQCLFGEVQACLSVSAVVSVQRECHYIVRCQNFQNCSLH
jgi:hypothetical protein